MAGDDFEACLIPGLPVDLIRRCYESGKGREIASGKFASPESSAALVANAFGLFLDRPSELPPLPCCGGLDWPASEVALEREVRFPWRGGLHPWLDVVITTPTALIGVESKRYEPFRPKRSGSRTAPIFSEAYSRAVWGDAMTRYEEMRDLISAGRADFVHLDASQLVKHAFGLRTAVHRAAMDTARTPVLFYLFAEPTRWPGASTIPPAETARHRAEIERFSRTVAGDEVRFEACSYGDLLKAWGACPSGRVRDVASALGRRFDL